MLQHEAAAQLTALRHAVAEEALAVAVPAVAEAVVHAEAVEAVEDNTIQGPHVTLKQHGDFLAKKSML